jgi:hypothetical protein
MQNLEWLNENSLRAYPIRENMGRHPRVQGTLIGGVQLPNKLLLDFNIAVPGTGNERIWLSRVITAGSLVSFTFSEILSGAVIATASVDLTSYNEGDYVQVPLVAASGYTGVTGRISVAKTSELEDWLDGIYDFDSDQTELEFCLVRNVAGQLSGLRAENGGNLSELLTGTVKIIAGSNIKISYNEEDNSLTFSAIPGEGYVDSCGECPVADNIVRTINGIPMKDVKLISGNDCIEITTSGNTITITDKCSTPCCGCSELEAATTRLAEFDALTTDIQTYRTRLENAILMLQTALAQVQEQSGN